MTPEIEKKALEQASQGMGIIRLAEPEIAKILLFLRAMLLLSVQQAQRLLQAGDREGAVFLARMAFLGEELPGCSDACLGAKELLKRMQEDVNG